MIAVFGLGLAIAIAIGFPIWDRIEYARLADGARNVGAREAFYLRVIAVEWVAAFLAVAAVGPRDIFTLTLATRAPWVPPSDAVFGFAIAFAVALAIPIVGARAVPAIGSLLQKQIAASPLFPTTLRERTLFFGVGISAGICEEIIYRGFFMHELRVTVPATSLLVIVAIASVLFALAHLGQGPGGVVATGVLGLIFTIMYVASGSLLLPIVLHIVADIRFCLLPPQHPTQNGEAPLR